MDKDQPLNSFDYLIIIWLGINILVCLYEGVMIYHSLKNKNPLCQQPNKNFSFFNFDTSY